MMQITMPRLSDTMKEGTVSAWRKGVGDRVETGDTIAEIESDKATMDFDAYESGTLTAILVAEGETVPIGTPIAELDGTQAAHPTAAALAPSGAIPIDTTPLSTPRGGPAQSAANTRKHLLASPVVRTLAREHSIDLHDVIGTGPGGRIIRTDISSLIPGGDATTKVQATTSPASPVLPPRPSAPRPPASTTLNKRRGTKLVPLDPVHRITAQRLAASARSIPHYSVTAVADVDDLVRLRTDLNQRLTASGRVAVSINVFLMRAAALALRAHPMVNSSYGDDAAGEVQLHHHINIGMAVATEHGLLVPVIDEVDTKPVGRLAEESQILVQLARNGRLNPEQLSGGTFTISNLGMYDVEEFTAIINPPEGAILAIGAVKPEAAVVNEQIVPRHRIRYTLNCDHRLIDGALAAQWLQTFTTLTEDPWAIMA